MNNNTKTQIHSLAEEMNRLCEGAAGLCKTGEPSPQVESLSATFFNLQKHLDFAMAVTTDEPPGDLEVRINAPGADEEIRLEACWDKPANGFRLKSVPIALAAVARAIDSELADRKHTGMVSFSWVAIPVELAGIVE